MEQDFIYWRHPTIPGIKIEEVTGGEGYSGGIWLEMARQLYCENGKDEYREIGHFATGAPFLFGESSRISITHCPGLFAVATLAPTPETDLSEYSARTALGIDAERNDRKQVLNVRERFLSQKELDMIPGDDLQANIQAWTIKEAAYKAMLREGLDFQNGIIIEHLSKIGPPVPVFDPADFGLPKSEKQLPEEFFGEVTIMPLQVKLTTYSYLSDDFLISLAYSLDCARFGKTADK